MLKVIESTLTHYFNNLQYVLYGNRLNILNTFFQRGSIMNDDTFAQRNIFARRLFCTDIDSCTMSYFYTRMKKINSSIQLKNKQKKEEKIKYRWRVKVRKIKNFSTRTKLSPCKSIFVQK